jgi:hypothetical protein
MMPPAAYWSLDRDKNTDDQGSRSHEVPSYPASGSCDVSLDIG